MPYIADFVHEFGEINKNNNHQWNSLIETICQGDIRDYLFSNFWEDYLDASSKCEKALAELENEVDNIVEQVPCK